MKLSNIFLFILYGYELLYFVPKKKSLSVDSTSIFWILGKKFIRELHFSFEVKYVSLIDPSLTLFNFQKKFKLNFSHQSIYISMLYLMFTKLVYFFKCYMIHLSMFLLPLMLNIMFVIAFNPDPDSNRTLTDSKPINFNILLVLNI